MINNKQELKRYLEMDAAALGVNPVKPYFLEKRYGSFKKA